MTRRGDMRTMGLAGTAAARAAIWIAALAAVPFLLVFAFLVAARWLIWFLAGLLLMVYTLGSAEYVRWFWLAFLLPLFVGGLVDGAFAAAAEARRRRPADLIDPSAIGRNFFRSTHGRISVPSSPVAHVGR